MSRMEALIKSNFEKLRHIYMYYDSEPMEILQSLVWVFLLIPMTMIELGFRPLIHTTMFILAVTQIVVVLNYSLNARKILSFVLFLITTAITANYILSGMVLEKSFMVFLFNVFFAFFNLKRLTMEKLRKE